MHVLCHAPRAAESLIRFARFIALQRHDYSSRGMYFVTVCTRDRERLFGSVADDGRITSTDSGRIVDACWMAIPEHFPGVVLDAWVTMPNHLHGILILREATNKSVACVACPGEACLAPTNVGSGARGPRRRSIGAIVGSFKSAVTKRINERRATPDEAVWQRNFYDYLIRDQDDLHRVRRYIENNPIRWASKYNGQGDACVAPTNASSRTNTPARRRE
jgi:putative transposase